MDDFIIVNFQFFVNFVIVKQVTINLNLQFVNAKIMYYFLHLRVYYYLRVASHKIPTY